MSGIVPFIPKTLNFYFCFIDFIIGRYEESAGILRSRITSGIGMLPKASMTMDGCLIDFSAENATFQAFSREKLKDEFPSACREVPSSVKTRVILIVELLPYRLRSHLYNNFRLLDPSLIETLVSTYEISPSYFARSMRSLWQSDQRLPLSTFHEHARDILPEKDLAESFGISTNPLLEIGTPMGSLKLGFDQGKGKASESQVPEIHITVKESEGNSSCNVGK